jgi:hypothetical protein
MDAQEDALDQLEKAKRHSPRLFAYYEKCAVHIAFQVKGKETWPHIRELPTPPTDIEFDEDEIKDIFEGFFRREFRQPVRISFGTPHYA